MPYLRAIRQPRLCWIVTVPRQADGGAGAWRLGRQRQLGAGGGPPSTQRLPRGRAPNPLRGLPDDSAYLAAFLGTISGPIVLVGHSYGGAVITNAATGNANVKALVYVDAFIPDQGQTLLEAGDPVLLLHGFPFDPTARRPSWTRRGWRGWTASRSPA